MPPIEEDMTIDMDAALASMDEGFGSGTEDAGTAAPSVQPATPAATPSPAAAAANVPQPQEWDQLPKSWKKDLDGEWKLMTPAARQYVYEREKQQLDGLMQYKGKVDKWDETLKPFKEFIDKNKLDPYDSVRRLGAVELVLREGTDQDKAQYLGEMIRHYGLAPIISQLMGQQAQQAPQFQRDPLLLQTQQELNDLKAWRQQQQEQVSMEQVTAFIDDPKNVHASDLIEDMTRIMGAGQAKDLATAYEMAMWTNQAVREKVLAEKIKEATTAPKVPPRLVRSSGNKATPTEEPKGSMEDTMRETYAAITARS